MKIGILTFHRAHNYGAVLQCYALQEVLKGMGHEVEVIDYRPSYIELNTQVFSKKKFLSMSIKHKIQYIITEPFMIKRRLNRYSRFNSFINKYLNLSSPVLLEADIAKYDIIVCGSDQIWNIRITRGFDNFFWGIVRPEIKKVSYAASMECVDIKEKDLDQCKLFINNFSQISVREENLKLLLQPLTNTKIHVTCDPTFLLRCGLWSEIAGNDPFIKGRYVVVYQTRHSKKVVEISKKIKQDLRCDRTIYLSAHLSLFADKNDMQSISPIQFLNIIKFATFVVTTSFHGTAFSLIFRKDFFTIRLDDNNDSRSYSLLNRMLLDSRFVNEYNGVSSVDYSGIEKRMITMVEESCNFLKQSMI